MVVDVPNITMAFQEMGYRTPNWHALKEWADERAYMKQCDYAAMAFLNFPLPHQASLIKNRKWQIRQLTDAGFHLVVQPKQTEEDDIDEEMLSSINDYIEHYNVKEVIIISHDMNNFRGMINRLKEAHIACSILAFPEQLGYIGRSRGKTRHYVIPIPQIAGFAIPK